MVYRTAFSDPHSLDPDQDPAEKFCADPSGSGPKTRLSAIRIIRKWREEEQKPFTSVSELHLFIGRQVIRIFMELFWKGRKILDSFQNCFVQKSGKLLDQQEDGARKLKAISEFKNFCFWAARIL